jgi:hypothetical protein
LASKRPDSSFIQALGDFAAVIGVLAVIVAWRVTRLWRR